MSLETSMLRVMRIIHTTTEAIDIAAGAGALDKATAQEAKFELLESTSEIALLINEMVRDKMKMVEAGRDNVARAADRLYSSLPAEDRNSLYLTARQAGFHSAAAFIRATIQK